MSRQVGIYSRVVEIAMRAFRDGRIGAVVQVALVQGDLVFRKPFEGDFFAIDLSLFETGECDIASSLEPHCE